MSFPLISRDSPVGFPAAAALSQGGSHWRDLPGLKTGPSLCDAPRCFPQRHLQLPAMQGPYWGAPVLETCRDQCSQPKQCHTLHKSCKPYSTDEVSTSSACRQEGPCDHQRVGPWMGTTAQGKGQVCSCLCESS